MERGRNEEKKRIMVAIDESAMEWTLQNLHGSELVLFTAQSIDDYGFIYASSFGAAFPELIAKIQEYQKQAAIALLGNAKDACSRYGIVAKTVAEIGDPKEVICEAVKNSISNY